MKLAELNAAHKYVTRLLTIREILDTIGRYESQGKSDDWYVGACAPLLDWVHRTEFHISQDAIKRMLEHEDILARKKLADLGIAIVE
jgi:hypothetical protein